MSHPETARILRANYERVSRALTDDPARVREFSEIELIEARSWARPLAEERDHVAHLCALELAARRPDPRPRLPLGWPIPEPAEGPEPCERCGSPMTAACRPCERAACPACPCTTCGG